MTFDHALSQLIVESRQAVAQLQTAPDQFFSPALRMRNALKHVEDLRREGASIVECSDALADARMDAANLASKQCISGSISAAIVSLGVRFCGWPRQ